MKHHSELINHLIRLRGLESYCEIGTFDRSHNFDKINCLIKCCIDPDPNAKADFVGTSDDFFEGFRELGLVNHKVRRHIHKFDLVFIDGLHHADQVKKDFENALSVLSDNGFIVMHDCNPHKEAITHVPRDSREWTGDTYKFACTLSEYAGIDFRVVNFDYGCAVVWLDNSVTDTQKVGEITWERFEKEKEQLLRLVSVEQFIEFSEKLG